MARRPAGTRNKAQDPHKARLRRLRTRLRRDGIDHFLVTDPKDVGYLTGFLGGDSHLVVGPRKAVIISDFRYEEELAPFAHLATIVMRTGPILDATARVLAEAGAERVGVQGEHVTLSTRDAMAAAFKRSGLGARAIAPTTGVVGEMRSRKDEHEVALIRRAIRIQEAAMEAVIPTIRPGQTELEIAGRLEAEMKARGSTQPGFTTIVAARANGSLPHYRPTKTKAAKNKPLLIDWGAVHAGYHGDMTRTFTLGRWPAKIREIYEIVLDAQEMAAAALAPGRRTREVDAVARNHIARHGYGDCFGHGLGHGMGMDGHEDPRLSHMTGDEKLEPGHVVTVEPGIYLPGIGGVRIEDDYVITERGAQNLCRLPKTLEWSTL